MWKCCGKDADRHCVRETGDAAHPAINTKKGEAMCDMLVLDTVIVVTMPAVVGGHVLL